LIRDNYSAAGEQARRNAQKFLQQEYEMEIVISRFDAAVIDALWPKEKFSWDEVTGRDFGPASLEIAIWIEGRLEVLAVCSAHGPQLIVRHVEGRPECNPRARGQRFWMVLEVAANFATALGKRELWWHPEAEEFLRFCLENIGAEQVGRQCRLRIPS
jgi:hypothetical protein